MTFVRRNITHILQPKEYSISHQPAATVRIQRDGNCFFRALAFVITGSQDEHLELRAIATSNMLKICHATLMLMKHLARTDMHSSSVWATEVEIFAVFNM